MAEETKQSASIGNLLLGVSAGAIGSIVVLVILGGALLLYQGFVLSWLWLWFVTPLGVPSISILGASGLMVISHLMIAHSTTGPYEVAKLINPYKVILNIGHHTMTPALATSIIAKSEGLEAQINKKDTERLIWNLARPAITLILGWLVHLLM